MTDHATEFCPCGHRLRTALEQDVGLCMKCALACPPWQVSGGPQGVPVGESFEWERELKREETLLHESQRRRA